MNSYTYLEGPIEINDYVKIPCAIGKVIDIHWKWGNENPYYIVEDIVILELRYGQKENELQRNSFRFDNVKKIKYD